jgi:Zn-dependent protease
MTAEPTAIERVNGPSEEEESTEAQVGGPIFYKTNARSMSWAEYRAAGPLRQAILAFILFKVFRLSALGSPDDVAVDRLDTFRVEPPALKLEDMTELEPLISELEQLGFHSPEYYYISDKTHRAQHWLVTFAHRSRPVAARIHRHLWTLPKKAKSTTFTEFVTEFEDGTFLLSVSSKADLATAPSCRVIRRVVEKPAELLKAHLEQLAREPGAKRTQGAFDAAKAREIFDDLHEATTDFHVERGVFVPADSSMFDSQRIARSKFPEVMAELDRIERQTTSWRGAVVILIFSLIVFLGIGFPGQTSFMRLLALVPILLFHETGHYIAMRVFGYRNLKMFFIPGFGAAVTGRHYNVAGWKKVVVSLMGPVPGIVLGIAIGACGIYWRSALAMEASLLMLALNAFNLIPILPLDGGHVARVIIFARHYWLDIGFRAVAALAFLGLAALAKSPFLAVISLGMILGLPTLLRTSRIGRDLQKEGFTPVVADSGSISPDVADKIIERLKAGTTKPVHPRLLAQQTLTVFENLNSKPPGWFASLGLLSVHVLSLVAAIVFAIVLVIAQRGPLRDFLRDAAMAPRHTVKSSEVVEGRSADPSVAEGDRATIIATFADRNAAKQAFEDLNEKPAGNGSATLYGDSVFVKLPVADVVGQRKLRNEFKRQGAQVGTASQEQFVWFTVFAVAPSTAAAESVDGALSEYFELRSASALIAPWSAKSSVTEAQRISRKTFARLTSLAYHEDPELSKLGEQLDEHEEKPETPASIELNARYEKLRRRLELEQARAVAADTSEGVDQAMTKRYLELFETVPDEEFRNKFDEAAAPFLGVVDPAIDPTAARMGAVLRSGIILKAMSLSFEDPIEGMRAFTSWLESKGFTNITYDVQSYETSGEEENAAGTSPAADPSAPAENKKPG